MTKILPFPDFHLFDFPTVLFSPWIPWNARSNIPKADFPGVYLLAQFNSLPSSTNANPLDPHIVYIGETCNNSLRGRLEQFNRSAFKGKSGHSGGHSYAEKFNRDFKSDGVNLYVAAFAVSLPAHIQHLFIRWVERHLILQFEINHPGKLLNKK